MAVIITDDLVLSVIGGTNLPLNYARIGYQSYLYDFLTYGAPVEVSGFPFTNSLTSQTFEYYKTATPDPTLLIDLGTLRTINYLALIGRNISIVELEYSLDAGATYIPVAATSDTNDKSYMILFDEISARYWRVKLTGSAVELINIKLGQVLEVYRPIYGGHSPLTLSRVTAIRPNISEGGEFLGSSIVRKGYSTNYSWQHLPAAWYREYFDPFVQYARGGAFYIAWNPEQYPREVGYCLTTDNIQPQNMGVRDLMSVGFNVEGYDAN